MNHLSLIILLSKDKYANHERCQIIFTVVLFYYNCNISICVYSHGVLPMLHDRLFAILSPHINTSSYTIKDLNFSDTYELLQGKNAKPREMILGKQCKCIKSGTTCGQGY